MKAKQLAGMAIGLVGITIIFSQSGWILGTGIFLALWGNNLEQSGRR